ncbi:MAG: branched-chain amino acid ABC transporter permease [Chloroflexi bacterium]|nr:branched-chain amino acid ABC transporter permease [Chloroflexota bacterium]
MDFFLQISVSGLMVGAVYSLIALGFVLILKATGILNLAQGELLLIGAFVCWALLDADLPLWLSIIVTLAIAALLGLLLERFLLRPMIGQPLISIMMMTIALSVVLKAVAGIVWGSEPRSYPSIFPLSGIELGPVSVSTQMGISCLIALAAVAILSAFFKWTKLGLGMRAVAEDPQAARATGVRIKTIFSAVWIISAMIAAIGGFLLGASSGLGLHLGGLGLKTLAVVLLGGLESIKGAILAGFIVGVAENLAIGYIDPFLMDHGIRGAGIGGTFTYIIMMLVLLVRPYGLFGQKRIERI